MASRHVRTLFTAVAIAASDLSVAPASNAQAAPVTIPDTPAGRTLQAWLAAFNSGDRAQLDAYYKTYQPDMSADGEMGFRKQTGGFDLISIQTSEPLRIVFMVKEKASETVARGTLILPSSTPGPVTTFGLRAVPRGATLADFSIDAAERARAIDGVVAQLNEFYVFPDVAKKMEDAVRARQKSGAYDAVTDGDAYAQLLTADLRAVSHDRHLGVTFSPAVIPDRQAAANTGPSQQYREQMEKMHCGFEKNDILPGNIGYLKFNMFADPEVCGATASLAMNVLGDVTALIVDLRENGGGSPAMVAYVSSYLFDKPTHLNDLWNRKENSTKEFWTRADVPGKRLANVPVYVLTSARTFSGAEEFSYNLKMLKRATIIGETTGGGAHPVSGRKADDHFMVGVPGARAINPVSKTNWEGVGVEPDIKVPAADALATALKLAGQKVGPKT